MCICAVEYGFMEWDHWRVAILCAVFRAEHIAEPLHLCRFKAEKPDITDTRSLAMLLPISWSLQGLAKQAQTRAFAVKRKKNQPPGQTCSIFLDAPDFLGAVLALLQLLP